MHATAPPVMTLDLGDQVLPPPDFHDSPFRHRIATPTHSDGVFKDSAIIRMAEIRIHKRNSSRAGSLEALN